MDLFFKALQDSTRRNIVEMLKHRNLNAGEIAEAFQMSKPSVSYHLDVLKRARIVSSRRKGQHVEYALKTEVLDESVNWISALFRR